MARNWIILHLNREPKFRPRVETIRIFYFWGFCCIRWKSREWKMEIKFKLLFVSDAVALFNDIRFLLWRVSGCRERGRRRPECHYHHQSNNSLIIFPVSPRDTMLTYCIHRQVIYIRHYKSLQFTVQLKMFDLNLETSDW